MPNRPPPEVLIEEPDEEETADPADRALREAAVASARVAISWSILSAAVLVVAIWLLRDAMRSADQFLKPGSDYGFAAFTPALLLALVGLLAGAGLSWRVSSATGFCGAVTVLFAILAAAIMTVAGVCAAWAAFSSGVPTVCWIGLAAVDVAVIAGAMIMDSISN